MAFLIPESLTRLQAHVFVDGAELDQTIRRAVIQQAAVGLAEQALRKLLDDCVETTSGYMGYEGQRLSLDVYVLTPRELDNLLITALSEGAKSKDSTPPHGEMK